MMGFLFSSSAVFLLASVFGFASVLSQELREGDAFCNTEGCFVIYFEPKIFLDSWRSCKQRGGNLATIKRRVDASSIAALFSSLDLRGSRTKVKVWIGLQRPPHQCSSHQLRGFSWTTGDQDTEYTNWQREEPPGMCGVPRCVALGYSTQDRRENLMWGDGPCFVPVDGYLCHFAYRGMCSASGSGGSGSVSYTTPFNLVSTILTHVPLGSIANVSCPANTHENKLFFCTLRKNGLVGWSQEPPFCPGPPIPNQLCSQDNGGCDHVCREGFGQVVCDCNQGFYLKSDGRTCEPEVCWGNGCEFVCLPLPSGYGCACPDGYELAQDGRSCQDVDECLWSPCPQLCENLPGSFECRCGKGYVLSKEGVCEDVDECLDGLCEHHCENTDGSYACWCNRGFSVDSEERSRCVDVDECQFPGMCEQMCANHVGGFQCFCEEGYELWSDQVTCRKIGADVTGSATPPVLTGHWPDFGWDLWAAEPSSDDRQVNQERPLAGASTASEPEVIGVTRASQLPLHSVTQRSEDLEQRSRLEETATDTLMFPTTSFSVLSHQHEEDVTAALPFLSTSTDPEGAWNWWPGFSTSSQRLENPAKSHTDPDRGEEGEQEKHRPHDYPQFPGQTSGEENNVTHSDGVTAPTEVSTLPPSLDEGGGSGEHEANNTALLVGVLVSVCVLLLLMVAVAFFCCTHRGVKPRNKNATECYHWIADAHDKQGALNPPMGDKTPV